MRRIIGLLKDAQIKSIEAQLKGIYGALWGEGRKEGREIHRVYARACHSEASKMRRGRDLQRPRR